MKGRAGASDCSTGWIVQQVLCILQEREENKIQGYALWIKGLVKYVSGIE